jgi:hypothetical protein
LLHICSTQFNLGSLAPLFQTRNPFESRRVGGSLGCRGSKECARSRLVRKNWQKCLNL